MRVTPVPPHRLQGGESLRRELREASPPPFSPGISRVEGLSPLHCTSKLRNSSSPSVKGVCLLVDMKRPPPRCSKSSRQPLCPLTKQPLSPDPQLQYFLTHKSLIEHSQRLAAEEREQGRGQARYLLPPLLQCVCPELTVQQYATEKHNPMFLYKRVAVSEAAFLECSMGLSSGHRTLCPARKRALSTRLWAASTGERLTTSDSAPVLPSIERRSR